MAIEYEKTPLSWENKGTEPPDTLKQSGWQPAQKPASAYFNYEWALVNDCLKELQVKLSDYATLNDQEKENMVRTKGSGDAPSTAPLIDSDLLEGHPASYFATSDSVSGLENRVTPISLGGTGATTAAEALANLGADFAGRCKIGVITGDGNQAKDHTLAFNARAVFVFLRNSPFIEYDATNGVTKVNSVFVTADKGGSIGADLFLNTLTLSQSQDAAGTNGRFLNLNKSGAQYVYFALK